MTGVPSFVPPTTGHGGSTLVWLRRLAILLAILLQLVWPYATTAQPESRCATGRQYPIGAVFALDNSRHLWLFAGADGIRWVGDTRALASVNFPVRWDATCLMAPALLTGIKVGDPILSAGLIKIGDPIYLAKWEQGDPSPVLLHIQSISDVEAFGINTANYTRFVLDRANWEQRYGFNADSLQRGELAAVGAIRAGLPMPTSAPARPTPAPPPPRPIATPVPPRPTTPVVAAPNGYPQRTCLRANPSCDRDPWWVEWNELPGTEMVTYAFAPGLTTEAKYIEVIWLLWLWPESRALIQEASSNKVTILTLPSGILERLNIARYSRSLNAVGVNPNHNYVSTWMLADTIAHELKHASDRWQELHTRRTYSDCIVSEQRAFAVERRYTLWVSAWQGGLPTERQVAATLSADDLLTFLNIQAVLNTTDLDAYVERLYRDRCTRSAQAGLDPFEWWA